MRVGDAVVQSLQPGGEPCGLRAVPAGPAVCVWQAHRRHTSIRIQKGPHAALQVVHDRHSRVTSDARERGASPGEQTMAGLKKVRCEEKGYSGECNPCVASCVLYGFLLRQSCDIHVGRGKRGLGRRGSLKRLFLPPREEITLSTVWCQPSFPSLSLCLPLCLSVSPSLPTARDMRRVRQHVNMGGKGAYPD